MRLSLIQRDYLEPKLEEIIPSGVDDSESSWQLIQYSTILHNPPRSRSNAVMVKRVMNLPRWSELEHVLFPVVVLIRPHDGLPCSRPILRGVVSPRCPPVPYSLHGCIHGCKAAGGILGMMRRLQFLNTGTTGVCIRTKGKSTPLKPMATTPPSSS